MHSVAFLLKQLVGLRLVCLGCGNFFADVMLRITANSFHRLSSISCLNRSGVGRKLGLFGRSSANTMASGASSQTTGLTKDELKKRLTPLQYHVTQEKGTERPFTGEYEKNKEDGIYKCVVCGNVLFKSDHKYDSGSGWPSFYAAANKKAVKAIEDKTHGMSRTEVVCEKCAAHLGHVFTDGPQPSGERFCMNSASLSFEKGGKA